MANEQNVSETVLKYRVTGVNEATRSAEQVKRGQQQLAKELEGLSPTTQRAVSAQRAEFRKLEADLKEANALVRTLRAELKKVDETTVAPKITVNEEFDRVSRDVALAGDTQSNLGALRGLADVAGLSGVGSGLGVAGELVALVEELPRLKTALQGLPDAASAAFSTLGAGGLAAIAGLAAVGLALDALSKQGQKVRQETLDGIQAEIAARRELDALTRAQAEQRLAGLRDDFDREVAERNQLAQQVNDAFGQLNAAQQNLFYFGSTIDTQVAAVLGLNDAYLAQQDVVDKLQIDIDTTSKFLQSNGTAAADAAALQAAAERQAASAIQQAAQARLQAEQFAATATTESVNARIAGYQAENRILTAANNELLASGTEASLALYNQNLATIALNNAAIEATSAIRGEVAAREALSGVIGRIGSLAKGLADGIRGIPDAAADFKKQADVVTTALARVDEEEQRHADAMAAIRSDLAAKETAIMTEARAQAAELGDKYGIERTRAVEDLEDELARIRSRAALDEAQAAQSRNAVAFDRAKSEAEQQEDEATKQADKLARRRAEDYQRELQQLVVATNKRLTTERDAANKQLNLEVQKYSAEISVRKQALTAAQNQFAQYVNGLISTGASGYQVALNQFGVFINGLIGRASGGLTSNGQPLPGTTVPYPPAIGGSGGSVTGTGIQGATRTRALGGWTQGLTLVNDGTGGMRGIESATLGNKQVIYFDRPTRINNARETATTRGASLGDIYIDGWGMTPREVGQAVERKIEARMEEFVAGFEEEAAS